MKRSVLLVMFALCANWGRDALAFSSYRTAFNSRYGTAGTKLDSCATCHDTSPAGSSWNSYGTAFLGRLGAGDSVAAALANIEPADSDGDGFTNLAEIQARTWPGDANDKPVTSAPVIGVAPATLAFGNLLRGSAAVLTLTITNSGNAALSVTGLTPAGSPEFALTNAPVLPLAVPAGGSAKLSVRYAPTNTGPDTGALAVGSTDPTRPTVTVNLTGTGVAPALTVSPAALAFGSLLAGQTTNLTLTLGNTGSATANVSVLAKTGSTEFAFGPGAPVPPFAITPGSTVIVPLAYTPANVGPDAGNLQVGSDDPVNPTVNVPLSGTGNALPAVVNITVAPGTLGFGNVRVGQSATLSAAIGNTGSATGAVTGLTVSGSGFALAASAPATPFAVPPGASIPVAVTYAPSATGNGIGSLTVASNDPNNPSQVVSLTGSGVQSHIAVVPVAIEFGTVTIGGTAARSLAITNAGGASLELTGLSLTASAEMTVLSAPALPATLGAGQAVTVTLVYAPTDPGLDSGSLVVASDAANAGSLSVSLAGSGQEPVALPQVSLTPATLNFGDVRVGQTGALTVTVNNSGAAAAIIGAPALSGSAEFAAVGSGFSVPAGGSQVVTVQYAPAGTGSDVGTVSFSSNDPLQPTLSARLSGRGVRPFLSVTPVALNFGSVIASGTVTRVVTILNTGSASAQVTGLTLVGSPEFGLGNAAPAVPVTVAAGANVDVPLTYRPLDAGADTGTLAVATDDPAHPSLLVALSGTGVSSATALDFDITGCSVPGTYTVGRSRPFQVAVRLANRSRLAGTRPVTVVGIQGDVEVYRVTQNATLKARGTTTVRFPALAPLFGGRIDWTVTVQDDDPDTDIVTAQTNVTGPPRPRPAQHEHEEDDTEQQDDQDH